jgi:hypothetical protein
LKIKGHQKTSLFSKNNDLIKILTFKNEAQKKDGSELGNP